MARAADDAGGKSLWLTLALSWVRLADHAARSTNLPAADSRDQSSAAALPD